MSIHHKPHLETELLNHLFPTDLLLNAPEPLNQGYMNTLFRLNLKKQGTVILRLMTDARKWQTELKCYQHLPSGTTPQLLQHGIWKDQHYLLLEDLGTTSLETRLNQHPSTELARSVADLLVTLHQQKGPAYGSLLSGEGGTLSCFEHHHQKFSRALEVLKADLTSQQRQDLEGLFQRWFSNYPPAGPVLTHRDFRPANIMVTGGTCLLIDLETAAFEEGMLDLVKIHDHCQQHHPDFFEVLFNAYLKAFPDRRAEHLLGFRFLEAVSAMAWSRKHQREDFFQENCQRMNLLLDSQGIRLFL